MADTILGAASGNTGNAGNDQNNQQTQTQQTQTQTQEGNQKTQQTQQAQQDQQQTQTQQAQTQPQVPKKYEFKAPAGIELDQSLIDAATPIFKELKLTQEQAQKLVDLQTRAAQQWDETQIREHQELVTSWAEEAKKDPEFGGQNFDQNVAIAIKGMKAKASPELQRLLDDTGLGNHPEVIRHFYRLGLEVKEPSLLEGGPPKDTKTTAQILFPSMKG